MGMDVGRDDRSRRRRRGLGALACALTAVGLIALPSSAMAGAFGGAGDCQPYGKEPCLLPFPNDLFTKKDNDSKTGLSVDMPQAAMPTNEAGEQIDVAPYNRNDGFSPGSAIVVRVPGLDNPEALEQTNPVPLTDMSQAFKKRAPVVLIDEGNKERQLIWVEIDSNADGPENTTLLIHPGENLKYGHTYAVAMRRLKDADGNTLEAPDWFQSLRDGKRAKGFSGSEQARYDHIFKVLKNAGIRRGGLYEAWDFTVGSRKSLTKDMTQIRNAAFRGLGDDNLADEQVAGHAPRFSVDSVENNPEPGIARHIEGTFKVPCYLKADGCPTGSTFNRTSSGRGVPPGIYLNPTVPRPLRPAEAQRRQRRRAEVLVRRAHRRERREPRPRFALRPRPPRRGEPGLQRLPGGAGPRAQLHHLRHRLVGDVGERRFLRHPGAV
jgi:hypothetical protein